MLRNLKNRRQVHDGLSINIEYWWLIFTVITIVAYLCPWGNSFLEFLSQNPEIKLSISFQTTRTTRKIYVRLWVLKRKIFLLQFLIKIFCGLMFKCSILLIWSIYLIKAEFIPLKLFASPFLFPNIFWCACHSHFRSYDS